MLEHLRSQRKWNLERLDKASRRDGKMRFFDFLTVGTSGKRPEDLIAVRSLSTFRFTHLVDIRDNPNSVHTPYWNKASIAQFFEKEGVRYLHYPDLGVPAAIRKQLFSGEMSREEFFAWYDRNVLHMEKVQQIADLVKDNYVVLLCTELGPTYCHRHRLALKLESAYGYISYDL
jgi:uncharacterized protein (DUF488 family)